MLVAAIAPLGLRHPFGEARATTEVPQAVQKSRFDDSELHAPVVAAAQARPLTPLAPYRVRAGDSVESIAARAGITPDTLTQVNRLAPDAQLAAGQRLLVPPVDGTMVRVDPHQSLSSLATTFRVDVAALEVVNGLSQEIGLPDQLFIPATPTSEAAPEEPVADPGGKRLHLVRFTWPARGIITQYFWEFHPGIDIAGEFRSPEIAADGGRVVFAGWGAYGIYVEIDHGNGFHTIYGHMSEAVVATGQMVGKGQLIGRMGATGRATGVHLHFEIRFQGAPQNPFDLLA